MPRAYTTNLQPNIGVHFDPGERLTATLITTSDGRPDFITLSCGQVSLYINLQQAYDLALGLEGALGGTFALDYKTDGLVGQDDLVDNPVLVP